MNKYSKKNLLLFFRRFKRSYMEILKSNSGKNASYYLENFIQDNLKVAKLLFGKEGEEMMKQYLKKMPV